MTYITVDNIGSCWKFWPQLITEEKDFALFIGLVKYMTMLCFKSRCLSFWFWSTFVHYFRVRSGHRCILVLLFVVGMTSQPFFQQLAAVARKIDKEVELFHTSSNSLYYLKWYYAIFSLCFTIRFSCVVKNMHIVVIVGNIYVYCFYIKSVRDYYAFQILIYIQIGSAVMPWRQPVVMRVYRGYIAALWLTILFGIDYNFK